MHHTWQYVCGKPPFCDVMCASRCIFSFYGHILAQLEFSDLKVFARVCKNHSEAGV